MESEDFIKGRGAQKNVHNKFTENKHLAEDEFLNFCALEGEESSNNKTTFIETFPKSIVNKVKSPDVRMDYSLNPYQGCEHGCVYCYARNSHEYWGYSAGLDFEKKVLIKKNAVKLLKKKLSNKNYKAAPIVLSGNTDCYQPVEKKLEITRELLKVFLKYKHPIGIITKNALVQRDIDILSELAKDNLVRVNLSITSLNEDTRRLLEPRTASIKKRLETIEKLTEAKIPVHVMMAPIIPGINSHEILSLVKEIAKKGALGVGYTMVRLNGAIAEIFEDWIKKAMPNKAEKVLHLIESCHEGNLNDSQFGRRMRGSGNIAEQVEQQFRIARNRFLKDRFLPELNCALFEENRPGQLSLF